METQLNEHNTNFKEAPNRFSYYQGPITNTQPKSEVTLVDVYNLIKGDSFKAATSALREISDIKLAKKYKAGHFDYVTFSGLFSQRSNSRLRIHSGLLTVDFDHVPNKHELRSALLADQYFETELLFTSPSGDGLKWIIPIHPSVELHYKYFDAVLNYVLAAYNQNIDPTGREVSRACFLPHDPEVYINPNYL